MTDDDKALVARLREDMADVKSAGYYNDEHRDIDAACDRIEAQAARIAEWDETGRQLTTKVFEQAAEIERLREALRQIAAPAYVSVGTHKHMHLAWREIACRRIDIARDVLGETE